MTRWQLTAICGYLKTGGVRDALDFLLADPATSGWGDISPVPYRSFPNTRTLR